MKQMKLFFMLISLVLVFGACSNNDNNDNNEPEENVENNEVENNDEQEENDEPEEVVEEEETTPSADDVDFDALLAEVDEITQGTTELIYEQNEEQTHEEDAYVVNLNGYVVANITDFHMNFSTNFDSEEEGAVLLTHMTLENKTDGDIAFTPNWSIEYSGADRHARENKELIPREIQFSNELTSETGYVIPAGESVTGYVAFALRTVDIENIEKVDYANLIVPSVGDVYLPDEYEYENNLGDKGEFSIHVDGDGSAKSESDGEFYEDAIITKNMGDKTMVKEKSDIGKTETLGNSNITFEGYQFTEFEPNETEAPRFESFDTGIIVLTIQMLIENNESEALDLQSRVGKLIVNDGKQYLLQEGFLSPYKLGDVIEPGETGEMNIVYIMDKEQYDKIWKDKAFEFEFGPLKGVETLDLSKGKKLEFELPK